MYKSYQEMKIAHEKLWNALPLGFAFSNDQFNEMMNKWGLDPEKDCDKLYRIPGGGFIQKKDNHLLHDVLERTEREEKEFFASDTKGERGGILYNSFRYELFNTEYGYSGDESGALDALGLTLEEVNKNPAMKKAFSLAKRDVNAHSTF